MGLACFKKPLLEVGFRNERREQRLHSRSLAGNRRASPRSQESLPSPQVLCCKCERFSWKTFYLFFFFPPPPISLPFPFSLEASAVALHPALTGSESGKKKVSLFKKKKIGFKLPSTSAIKTPTANWLPSALLLRPLLRASGGCPRFQSESCCALLRWLLFLVLKRERIGFLNLRPGARGRKD